MKIIQKDNTVEIQSPMLVGKRILFALLALIPLIAPYQLIIQTNWENYLNLFFLFAAIISLGAMSVSAFLFWASIAGMSTSLTFDKQKGIMIYSARAPVIGMRTERIPLSELSTVELDTHEWSDGGPSYSILASINDARTFKTGSSWSKEEVEDILQKTLAFLEGN